jgi:hypothetical protein
VPSREDVSRWLKRDTPNTGQKKFWLFKKASLEAETSQSITLTV